MKGREKTKGEHAMVNRLREGDGRTGRKEEITHPPRRILHGDKVFIREYNED